MDDNQTPGASQDDNTAGSGGDDQQQASTTPAGAGAGQDTGTGADTSATSSAEPPAKGDDGQDGKDGKPAAKAAKSGKESEEFQSLPEWAQKRIRGLEKEAGDNRIKAKTATDKATESAKENAERLQGFIDGFAKVMGLTVEEDDKPQTLDAALAKLERSDAQLQQAADGHRQLEVKLAVWEQSARHSAVAHELMDSATFLAKIQSLDPKAEDFAAKLGDLIAAQVKENPSRFKVPTPKAATPPSSSGGEFTGGPGGRPNDAMSIQDHIRHIDPVQRASSR